MYINQLVLHSEKKTHKAMTNLTEKHIAQITTVLMEKAITPNWRSWRTTEKVRDAIEEVLQEIDLN